jgi:hypothetical protein
VNFSRCTRCSVDLIETGGRWDTPPPGYRIVWKKRQPQALGLPPPPPIDLPPEAYDAVPVENERRGDDRRATRDARVLTSLRSLERRGGAERRKASTKKQALPQT